MNPELTAIRKKYENKKDEASMMAMNEETKAVYAKYGVSMVTEETLLSTTREYEVVSPRNTGVSVCPVTLSDFR